MAKYLKSAAFAASIALAAALPSAALAQRNAAPAAPVVAIVNPDEAIQQSAAFTLAAQQIQTTYAPQIAARQTRAQALQTELQTLAQTVQTEQARSPQNQTALQNAINAYRTRETAAQQEVQTLSAPIDLAVSYAREQIFLRWQEALQAAVTARRVDVVISDGAVLWSNPATNLNPEIVTQLNRLVPNVQIVPPQGYQPGQLVRAQQQAQATSGLTPATPPAAQPATR